MRRFYSILVLSLCVLSFMIFGSGLKLDENFRESVRWTSHQQIANDNVFEWHSFEELS